MPFREVSIQVIDLFDSLNGIDPLIKGTSLFSFMPKHTENP